MLSETEFKSLVDSKVKQLLGKEDLMSIFYCELLKDTVFVSLLKELLTTEVDVETVYCKAIKHGIKLYDIKEAESILVEDDDPVRTIVYDPVDVGENKVMDINVSNVNSCFEKNNNYYVTISYVSDDEVNGYSISKIVYRSNLISPLLVINILKERFDSCYSISYQNNSVHLKIIEQFDTAEDYQTTIEIDNICAYLSFAEEALTITADNNCLWDLYYFLRNHTSYLGHIIDAQNNWSLLSGIVKGLSPIVLQIPLARLITDKKVLNICKDKGIKMVGDLLNAMPISLNAVQIKNIRNSVASIDYVPLNQLLLAILKKLNGKEFSVLKDRYLDNSLTLEEIGKKHGCTRERIRQIESKGFRKLASAHFFNLKNKVAKLIYLLSDYNGFITEKRLNELGLTWQYAVFIDKAWGDIRWSNLYRVSFFNGNIELALEKEVAELPTEFTKSELADYATHISNYIDAELSPEDIIALVMRRCNIYGDFIVKGRVNLRVVLTYLMRLYFPDGIDLYNDDNIEFLRLKAKEHFGGFELADNNRAVQARLQAFCVPVGRGKWNIDNCEQLISDKLATAIINYIENYNSPVIPIQSILIKFKYELELVDINNKYHLQGQIKKFLPKIYFVNRDYVFKNSSDSLYEVIEEFVKNSKTIVTKKDILKNFPGVSDIVIQQAVSNTRILNMNGYYVHLDNLNIADDEISTLKNSIDNCLNDGEIHHVKFIFNKLRTENAGLFSRIGVTHYLQCYYLIHELYPESYSYSRPFIAQLGVNVVSGEAQVLDRLSEIQEIPISMVREIAREVGTLIERYIEFIDRNNDLFLFKNQTTIATIEFMGVNDIQFEDLDNIISSFLMGQKYAPLSSFSEYWKLPKLNCPWNEWVLYSIVGKYSKLYKTAVSSNYLSDAVPFVVCNDINIADIDFNKIIEDSDIIQSFDEEELEDILDYSDLE